jgi:hypothetical protein
MSSIHKFKIYAQTLEDGTLIFTNCFVDVKQFVITHFCIPVDDDGSEMTELVKVFMYNINTLEPKEFIFNYDPLVDEMLKNFTNGI